MVAIDALRQILVDAADHDLLDPRVSGDAGRDRRQGVIGLVLDHGPAGHAQGADGPLGVVELVEQVPGQAGSSTCSRERRHSASSR